MLKLYTIFHLNIMYSSIEEDQRAEVIKKCYWPLLKLARSYGLPFGIEASAYSLETIADIDPDWVAELSKLTANGPCEFIGSGYTQLIGPLVPAKVNAANLALGNEAYEKLIGFRPKIALVNEQAYSAGLLQHYLNAGYEAIIMEWDNPASSHPEWDPAWRYLPQYACGQHGEEIALIWNNSIAFQKFQRYAHGDLDLNKYIEIIASHGTESDRVYPLYGNDVEVFDFRPGRFATEPLLQGESEWVKLEKLFAALNSDSRFEFISPSGVLKLMDQPNAGNRLQLETSAHPVPVKKQGKYNLTRWALTGRDDVVINTRCIQTYEALKEAPDYNKDDWRELCYLWSSDFRTHITEKRWNEYLKRLEAFQQKVVSAKNWQVVGEKNSGANQHLKKDKVSLEQDGHFLTVETEKMLLKLNCRRGLAIEGLWINDKKGPPLIGTLHHGFYSDIKYGADWYSGHLVLELLGQPKVTDLEQVLPVVDFDDDKVIISSKLASPLGVIEKVFELYPAETRLDLSYNLKWAHLPPGSFRLGFVTLNPLVFDRNTLYYETCNGGIKPERFYLAGTRVDHGSAVSFLVSANSGLGLTEGWVKAGDHERSVRIDVDRSAAALIGQVTYHEIGDSYFCRLVFSAGEVDDTRKIGQALQSELRYSLSVTMEQHKIAEQR